MNDFDDQMRVAEEADLEGAIAAAMHRPDDQRRTPELPRCVQTGILKRFLDLVGACTEAPLEFLAAAFLVAVACLLGRGTWIKAPHDTFANFYVLLVGSTGDSRKTTAARFGIDLLRAVAVRLSRKVQVLFALASAEGLAKAMLDDGGPYRVLVVEDELRSLFAKAQQRGVSNLIPRLTELYNCFSSFEVNTRHHRLQVDDPYISIIACSTSGWLNESVTESDVTGGFMNRWTCFSGSPEKVIPFPNPVDPAGWQDLVMELATAIENGGGELTLSPAAKDLYETFYREFRRRPGIELVVEATAREHTHAIKFAMVFAVLSGHRAIEAADMEKGVAMAKYCAQIAAGIATNLGKTRTGKREDKLLRALHAGPMTSREAMRFLHCSAKEWVDLLRPLQSAGLVRVQSEPSRKGGRPRQFIDLCR
jgi:Protein of unknown function (DUF3987)